MRRINTLLATGCLFLCSGGWVCNDRVIAEGLASDAKVAAINDSVAAAAAPEATKIELPKVEAPKFEAPKTDAPQTDTKADATSTDAAKMPMVVVKADTAVAAATQPTTTDLSATKAEVGPDGMVEQFNAQDLDINSVLRILAERSKRNIVASRDVKGTVTVNLYNVTLHEALDAILTPNGYGYVEKGNFIYVYTQKELDEINKKNRKPISRVFRLKYIGSKDAEGLIKPVLSSSASVASTPATAVGASSGSTDTGGMGYATDDTLVISDYKENLDEVDKVLATIDVRPKQVLVESTILRASLTDNNAMGIDFVSICGADFGNLISAGGTNNTGGGTNSTAIQDAAKTFIADGRKQTNVSTDFASSVPDGGLSIGFLSNSVSVFIRALETVADTNIVANPKIMALNKHMGRVQIGDELGYVGGKTTTTTSSTQTVEMLETGVILTFRPYIQDDGYVRMEIAPEDSAGRINAAGLPEKQKTQVVSNLMIKDGRTAVIGGLFREQTTSSKGQVPVLGNIPILGIPFRRTSDDVSRVETIVLLTPHIINDDTSLYAESEKRQEDVRRMMLGNRKGLQPWGRERLAMTWYEAAQDSLAKGKTDQAIMFTDWALNTNPKFIDAIKLKEELTHRKYSEPDASSISRFVHDLVAADQNKTPDTGGPGVRPIVVPTTVPANR